MKSFRQFLNIYIKAFGAALMLPFCLPSCISHHDTVTADVNPQGWQKPAVLKYANADTTALKEVALVLRYGAGVSPANGIYVIEAVAPSGEHARDTINVTVAVNPSGNEIQESRIPYRTNVTLCERGDYIFAITPSEKIYNIWSVAIDFKKLQ